MAAPVNTPIIAATEGTIDTTDSALEAHAFTLGSEDFPGSALPKLSGHTFGVDVILLWERVGNVWSQVYESAAAVQLDATIPQIAIKSMGTYSVSKASAVTAMELWLIKAR